MWKSIVGVGLALGAVLTPAASAQAPKSGSDYYEDTVEIGFKVKFPRDWEMVPPQPGEKNLMATFGPENGLSVQMYRNYVMDVGYFVVKFDNRSLPGEDEKAKKKRLRGAAESVVDWVDRIPYFTGKCRLNEKDETSIKGIPAIEYEFEADYHEGTTTKVFALSLELEPDLHVALVGNGPGDKRWRKYGKVYEKLAKSFRRIDVEEVELTAVKGESAVRAQKRAELQLEIANAGDWELYDSENYFIVTNNDDEQFIEELIERLEAIREVYEETYPPEEAKRMREAIALARQKEREEKGEPLPPEERATTVEADPFELSRASVVRVCKDKDLYVRYGGSESSAGYWSSAKQELVIFDDQERGGRRNTWATLNHEAFHQYIYYFYGNIAPHSWYNEGTGDFYSGYQLKGRRFKLDEFDWRVGVVKQMINEDRTVPLDVFLRWTQRDYYTSSEYGTHPGEHYAQGWAFIWFLRTGKQNARGWQDEWDKILPTYLETLLWTEDLDEAVEKAFADIDLAELDEAWKDYI